MKKITKNKKKKNLLKNKLLKQVKILPKLLKNTKKSSDIKKVYKAKKKKTEVKEVIKESKKPSKKMYFTKETEKYIIEYNKNTDDSIRNQIYEEHIKPAFEKLVENVFNTFKFTYFDNSPAEIQKETVAHLVVNMHKFEENKGRAFSYFSIVAKNYLIFHNNFNYKRFNQHVDISDTPSESSVCLQTTDSHHKDVETDEFMDIVIGYWDKNIRKIFTKQKEYNIANAVLELLRNSKRIDSFNKKALYLYIREISSCKTQQITKVINKMKVYQSMLSKSYLDEGFLKEKTI